MKKILLLLIAVYAVVVVCAQTTQNESSDSISTPACGSPNSLTVNEISGTAAMVKWENSGSDVPLYYELSYKLESESNWTVISPIHTEYHMLANLSPESNYQVRIRKFCDGTTSSNYLEIQFHTDCLDGLPDLVIGETFDMYYGEYLPTSTFYNHTYSQQIFFAQEIGTARTINAIGLQYFHNAQENRNIDIYLGHTQKSEFTSTSEWDASSLDWIPTSELTLVYSDTITFENSGENYWMEIPLSTSFEYNGTDNLVLVFDDHTGTDIGYWDSKFYTHSTQGLSTMIAISNEPIIDSSNMVLGYGYLLNYRNNLRLPGMCKSDACPMSIVSAVDITDTSAQLVIAPGIDVDGFELEYTEAGTDVYSVISSLGNSYLLTGLKQNTIYELRIRSICGENYSQWKTTSFTTGVTNSTRFYVTTTGNGNGNSWENATNNIPWAVKTARLIQEIYGTPADVWVAAGSYYGDTSTASQNAFTMEEGVNVYGGFAGNEPDNYDLSLRNLETNTTILDGQNARRVLYQPTSYNTETIWDGFVIQHGRSNYNGDNIGYGGGAYLRENGILSRCTINNNTARCGGGVSIKGSIVSCCIISNNTTNDSGGGIYDYNGSVISNCLISNNTANLSWGCGGGVYSPSGSNTTIVNTTIVRNTAHLGAGVFKLYANGGSSISNSIIWGNGEDVVNNIRGDFTCSYSAIEGGYPGEHNLLLSDYFNQEPMFVNPSQTSGASDTTTNVNWHLLAGSPCVNRGNSTIIDSVDLDGNTRIMHDTIDIGCYESDYYSSPIINPNYNKIYVTMEGAGTHSGEDWANATSSFSFALALARTYQADVWVAAGIYYGDTSVTAPLSSAFTMVDGANVYGGFAGTEPDNFDLSLRDFENNTTILDGKNERRVLGSPTLGVQATWDGFTLQNGQTDDDGGGANLSNGKLSHCIIKNNSAYQGGGVSAGWYSTVSNCIISNNTSTGYYGAGGLDLEHNSTASNCIVSYNTGYYCGGGVCFSNSTLSNCLIHNNSSYYGGGVYGFGPYSIINTTIVRNSANIGAGVYAQYMGNLLNSIVWGNGTTASDNISGTLNCSYSAVEGGYEGEHTIMLNEFDPPLFVNPSQTSGIDDNTENVDWHLQQGSACINRGNNASVIDSIDFDGTARIKRDTVDMGCYESDYYSSPLNQPEYSNIIYVTQNGSGTQTGEDWNNATSSISFALNMAQMYHANVWVAAGTYYGDTTADNAFTMVEGVDVYGGFTGNELDDYDLSLRDIEANATILDGQHARRVLHQPTSFNVITTWDGFTIQNGQTDGHGGGVYLDTKGKLSQCVVQNNISSYAGGGIYSERESTVSNCLISNNTASDGGGVYGGYNSTITNCQIINNTVGYSGGGVNAYYSTISYCQISNNIANSEGGGILGDYITISNCLISNNTASSYGGGISVEQDENYSSISNSTIVRNIANIGAGVFCGYLWMDVECPLTNCIVWGNGNNAFNNIAGNVACSYSAVEGGYEGDNNITLSELNPPPFVNPSLTAGAYDSTENVDWHLLQGSPCINSGNNAAVTDSLDLDGTTRIKHGTVDLGCYESDHGGSEPCSDVVYEFSHTVCNSYEWNGETYTQSGEYMQTFALENGCDSVVTLHLSVNHGTHNIETETACESFTWHGMTYTTSGTYTYEYTNAIGCACVDTLYLTVNYSNAGDTNAVANDRFDWYEHTYLTMSGDYTHVFTNQSGCDSVVTLHLTVTNPTITVQDTVMTTGYFIWHGMVFTSDTVLTETIPVLDGYDSVIIYHVFVTPTPLTVLTVDTCVSYTLNGQIYTETGDYVQTFPIPSGIDSVVVLYLTIFPADSADFAETACESFTWGGVTYTASGDYTQTFTNANGCDSVVTLHLTIFPADSADFAETACESFTWEGTTYTTTGDYTKTFTNVNGCDSVVTLHLTLFPADSADFAETACEFFIWEGTTYTTSGDYTQIFTNANGCDSVVTLHLTIFSADSADFAETACEFFTWEGTTYTTSGDYTKTFTNANGCDSVVTLHLTVNYSNSGDTTAVACDSFDWYEQTNLTQSGDYTRTITNAAGCDSVVTLHLTVNATEASEFAVETSDSCYNWNSETYCTSGDYTQTLQTIDGCDSLVTLHLTVSVGIDEHNEFNFNLYPNPTNGIVNVQCTNHNSPITQIHVFDAYGKLVDIVETNAHDSSVQTAQIDLSGFADGVYFVKAVAEGNVVAVRKVVKR